MGKYFGTDGIRGIANKELTSDLAYITGFAVAVVLTEKYEHKCKVLIGRDTRISGTMLECALSAGICAGGGDVGLLGVLPTPAVAYLTTCEHADAGIVISASHNPYDHNGIKIFGAEGFKLSDAEEARIEEIIDNVPKERMKTGADIGIVTHMEHEGADIYAKHVIDTNKQDVSKIKVLIDCANGAAAMTAKQIFEGVGVCATFLSNTPNGVNINDNCGSTHMSEIKNIMSCGGYDLGIAFDGDADRCLLVDERGEEIDGDLIMGVLAAHMKEQGTIKGGVVATIMSNLGLHMYLKSIEVPLLTTKVGDRYVLEEMVKMGYNIGGEQSGHMILTDSCTTGDGQLTAVTFLGVMAHTGKKASELCADIVIYPQVLINTVVPTEMKATIAAHPDVVAVGKEIASVFGERGRILIRPSGTEAKVRVMVEGENIEQVELMARKAVKAIENAVKNT